MNRSLLVVILLIIVAGAGGYWYMQVYTPSTLGNPNDIANGGPGTPPNTPLPAASSTGDGTSISNNLALGLDSSDKLGMYLIAYNGMTVYTYANDTKNVSTCTGQCAAAWPPYVVPVGTRLNLQAGVDGSIATTTRADGQLQVTYKGKPLYFYSGDKKSGDTLGQNVGGVWYVVRP